MVEAGVFPILFVVAGLAFFAELVFVFIILLVAGVAGRLHFVFV